MAESSHGSIVGGTTVPAAPAAEQQPTTKSYFSYTPELKLKRYYSILREFMSYYHGHDVTYPVNHEFTEEQLSLVQPQDIVNWLNMKVFGTLVPDFSGDTPISGSHHTISFYRKGIGHFMPGGNTDWDPLERTGNPTRSKAIRDLIATVKELNNDGVATPRNHKSIRKRQMGPVDADADDGDDDGPPPKANARGDNAEQQQQQRKKRRASRKSAASAAENEIPTHHVATSLAAMNPPTAMNLPTGMTAQLPSEVAEEMNGLLRQMHTQKRNFLRSLDRMSASVEMMKSEVGISYDLAMGQINNLTTRVAATSAANPSALASAKESARAARLVMARLSSSAAPFASNASAPLSLAALAAAEEQQRSIPKLPPRSRNLFAKWSVREGRLTPLGADWTFPNKTSVAEAMNDWFLGEPATNTPPLRYVTVGHMGRGRGPQDGLQKMRKFMKVVKYLGVGAGYWREDWDYGRINDLWEAVVPGVEARVGTLSDEERAGDVGWREMLGLLTREGKIRAEMAANSDALADARVEATARATEEASPGAVVAVGNNNGEETEEWASTPSPGESELLWGIHHGKLNPLPADWEFPTHVSIVHALNLWIFGDPPRKIPPFRYVHSSYVTYLKSGTGYLSKLRCVMRVMTHHGRRLGLWHDEEEDWDSEKIFALWTAVWDEIKDRMVFKKIDGAKGDVGWQAVYNQMAEKGLIKEVNAAGENDAADPDVSGEANVDRDAHTAEANADQDEHASEAIADQDIHAAEVNVDLDMHAAEADADQDDLAAEANMDQDDPAAEPNADEDEQGAEANADQDIQAAGQKDFTQMLLV